MPLLSDDRYLRWTSFAQGWTNGALLQHRDVDLHIASMPQSGVHWLKFMLGHALAEAHSLPAPADIQDERLIGHPKRRPVHDEIPAIVQSHSMPHRLQRRALVRRLLHFPRYVLLVRDMRPALVSNYEKWQERYDCDFATYLRGDVRNRMRKPAMRFNSDIWMRLRFLNEWNAYRTRDPERVLLVRYEDALKAPGETVLAIAAHLGLEDVTREMADRAAARATKDELAKANARDRFGQLTVRRDERHFAEWFSAADREFFGTTCRRNLVNSFGYDYDAWPDAPSAASANHAA